MHLVELLGLRFAQMDAFLRHDAQTGRLDHGVDLAGDVSTGRVRLQDREGACGRHIFSEKIEKPGPYNPTHPQWGKSGAEASHGASVYPMTKQLRGLSARWKAAMPPAEAKAMPVANCRSETLSSPVTEKGTGQ